MPAYAALLYKKLPSTALTIVRSPALGIGGERRKELCAVGTEHRSERGAPQSPTPCTHNGKKLLFFAVWVQGVTPK